jgi:molybdopterin-binding protein
VGDQQLTAAIPKKSAERVGLTAGDEAYIIKARDVKIGTT